ncbi:hypothetical protein GCM10025857_33310 [Alicyclobacillus contaminans]|nr:hypothetical protein GCM10025857_33310 [Alicyclobacillus contaminans]
MQLAYHNHDFEFARLGETVALDRLLTRTRPDRVQAELDLFWIHQAGCNPVDYIQRYAGRLHLLHVKDVHASDGSFAEVGQGVLPWRELLSTARAAGVRWYIVEQDVCPRDPIASIEASLTFLRKQFSQFQDEHPIGT